MTIQQYVRLVIETQSPMAINSGGRETGFDTELARDANGLPYIPATAIAGVWRHLAAAHLEANTLNCFFGTTDASSVLTISDGVIHNSRNRPMRGLLPETAISGDPLLSLLAEARPLHRERVAINDRGVAKDTGKFDQILLPAGLRFSIDFAFRPRDNSGLAEDAWHGLLSLWQDRGFCLGSTTRNGLGQIRVIASETLKLDLATGPESGKKLQGFRTSVRSPEKLDIKFSQAAHTHLLASLPLKALDNWRCGTGSVLLGQHNVDRVDMLTYSEPRITWKNGQGILGRPKPILCGSSIKGILAHRVAFHYRRRRGIWAEDMADAANDQWETRPDALHALFGHAEDEKNDQKGAAGQLYVDDCTVNYTQTVVRQHNSIDRFTGGVRKGALYNEELLYQPEFVVKVWLRSGTTLPESLKLALEDTFNDLKTGLLPMGAGSGRGASLVIPALSAGGWQVHADLINTVADAPLPETQPAMEEACQ